MRSGGIDTTLHWCENQARWTIEGTVRSAFGLRSTRYQISDERTFHEHKPGRFLRCTDGDPGPRAAQRRRSRARVRKRLARSSAAA